MLSWKTAKCTLKDFFKIVPIFLRQNNHNFAKKEKQGRKKSINFLNTIVVFFKMSNGHLLVLINLHKCKFYSKYFGHKRVNIMLFFGFINTAKLLVFIYYS